MACPRVQTVAMPRPRGDVAGDDPVPTVLPHPGPPGDPASRTVASCLAQVAGLRGVVLAATPPPQRLPVPGSR